jgi:MFS family permease
MTSSAPTRGQPEPSRSRLGALRNRNFTLLWGGLLLSNTGTWMQTVAQGWLVITLTNSPGWLGAASLARSLPFLVLPPLGGVIADRVDKVRLLKTTRLFQTVVTIVFAALTLAGVIQMWEILLLAFLSGAANSFDQPTRQALIPDLVEPRDLMAAISLNSSTFQGAALVGPAIAGLLVAPIGVGGVLCVTAMLSLAVQIALYLMRVPPARPRAAASLRTELREGAGFIGRTPLVWSLLLLTGLFAVFGRSYTVLLPDFAKNVLGVGADRLGFMYSMPGLGTLLGGFALAAFGDVRRKGLLLCVAGLISAALVVAFALAPAYALSLALLLAIGLATTAYSATNNTVLQMRAPGPMRGRVMSYNTVAMLGLTPFGGFVLGVAAEAVGVQAAIAAGGMVVALSIAAFYWLRPYLRLADSSD